MNGEDFTKTVLDKTDELIAKHRQPRGAIMPTPEGAADIDLPTLTAKLSPEEAAALIREKSLVDADPEGATPPAEAIFSPDALGDLTASMVSDDDWSSVDSQSLAPAAEVVTALPEQAAPVVDTSSLMGSMVSEDDWASVDSQSTEALEDVATPSSEQGESAVDTEVLSDSWGDEVGVAPVVVSSLEEAASSTAAIWAPDSATASAGISHTAEPPSTAPGVANSGDFTGDESDRLESSDATETVVSTAAPLSVMDSVVEQVTDGVVAETARPISEESGDVLAATDNAAVTAPIERIAATAGYSAIDEPSYHPAEGDLTADKVDRIVEEVAPELAGLVAELTKEMSASVMRQMMPKIQEIVEKRIRDLLEDKLR